MSNPTLMQLCNALEMVEQGLESTRPEDGMVDAFKYLANDYLLAEPTLEMLTEMAYQLQLVPRGCAVEICWFEVLKRQFDAVTKVLELKRLA